MTVLLPLARFDAAIGRIVDAGKSKPDEHATTIADIRRMIERSKSVYVAVHLSDLPGDWSYVHISHAEAHEFLNDREGQRPGKRPVCCDLINWNSGPSCYIGSPQARG